MRLLASSVVLAAGVLVGCCGAWWLLQAPRSGSSDATAAAPRPSACAVRLDAAQLALLRREVTAALRDAKDGASSGIRTDAATGSAAPVPSPTEELPSDEGLAAADDAHHHVHAAIARQRWSSADRDALRELMPRLTQPQTEELLSKLVLAINAGELRQDPPGPLF